jgi:hypothetical protein
VRSRFGKAARRRLGWRGLLYFWAVILTGGIVGAALLHAIGPPLKDPERPLADQGTSDDVAIRSAPAEPVRAGQPARPAFAGPEMPRNDEIAVLLDIVEAQLDKAHIDRPLGDNTTETLERVSAVLLQLLRADPQRIVNVKLRLYERAQARAEAGNFGKAERILALAAKLPANPSASRASMPDQAIPDRGAPAAQGLPLETEGSASPLEANVSALYSGPSKTPSTTTRKTISVTDMAGAIIARVPAIDKASPLSSTTIGAQRIASLGLSIHVPAHSPLAKAETSWLRARLGARFDYVKIHGETDMPSTAIIRYFSVPDHLAAREVGRLLGEMGYPWHIENPLTGRPASSPRDGEVWIPNAVHQN